MSALPKPNPDDWPAYRWDSDPLAEVLTYAVHLRYGYARTDEGYFLYRLDGTQVMALPMSAYRENPLQSARSLLEAINDETE